MRQLRASWGGEAALEVGHQEGLSGVWRSGEITWRVIRTCEGPLEFTGSL